MRLFWKSSAALLMLLSILATFLVVTSPLGAHAQNYHTPASCHNLLVHLNGSAPPTSTCLDRPQGGAHPFTSTSSCGVAGALRITSDNNQGGSAICFTGIGFVNMTQYLLFWPWTWNDQASSYMTGCNEGIFYADTNGNGQQQSFGHWDPENFDGQNGHLPNDSLSSLRIVTTDGCY